MAAPDENAIRQSSGSSIPNAPDRDPSLAEKVATQPDVEESLEARIERLGRERPPAFKSLFHEIAFAFSIYMSQVLTEYFVSGFTVILPTLITELDIPQASSVWPATAFSLVIASTLLVFGRLGDMWGGYPVYIAGLAWLTIWSIVCGFSTNPLMLDFCRALQGLGSAAFLPTGVMIMASAYRPGPRKNLVFALYGMFAVGGFFTGIFCAGIVGQYVRWSWYFWIGAILAVLAIITSIISVPNDAIERRQNGIKMDWIGTVTIVCGLVLVVFSITESAHAEHGWRTPYIPSLFVVGCLSLVAAVYVEGWVAEQPLLPADLFAIPCVTPLLFALLFFYGTLGIVLLYGTQYFQNILHATPLQVVAWYVPMVLGGLALALIEGFILHLVSGRILLIISAFGALGCQLLFATLPDHPNYWAWLFPAMLLGTIGIDLSITLASVFVTTQLPKAKQGLAGGLLNSVLQLGVALLLGVSDILQARTVDAVGLKASYKNTFWLGVGSAVAGLAVVTIWGNVPRAKSDMTADEKLELEREATRLSTMPSHPQVA
ncbi:uncharacterized protein A1O9_07391 [Exophiala aquamarina CBS 119918]|uniref:Major facilitator superfamily (MFS) profile domain-containing protein n=1 Tax=Exophiala aquamarina CBS 119918 TaxID=1182545 RepID=A0A072PBG8_9EURO|nr:uncharacterized protein A1O9_07391 [Exophiala aquamarina CBS 119918]KEF57201.1 hypothetical protein A1O9_07391 [Exophiala aquamarina CBS 119918]